MRTVTRLTFTLLTACFGICLLTSQADVLTWTADDTGNWFVVDNWTNTTTPEETRVPADGDDVVINKSKITVILDSSSAELGSLSISNATLCCSNWDTLLSASNVTILKNGILTCAGPFTNDAMSNRVDLVCSNLLIETGGAIDVFGRGYSGGLNIDSNYEVGHGPGGGTNGTPGTTDYVARGGGAHGGIPAGWSGYYRTNTTYGSATAPLYPGSGGAGSSKQGYVGAHGGGAVRIVADQVCINGAINASASASTYTSYDSGGSGGSVFITCRTITGTNGLVSANGSKATQTGGAGAGGRIAVIYDTEDQKELPLTSLKFEARGGRNTSYIHRPGEIGTLYFPDSQLFSPTNLFSGQWLAPGMPQSIELDNWVINNVWLRMPGIKVTVHNEMKILGTNYSDCVLELTNSESVINCGSLLLSNATFSLGAPERPFYTPFGNFWDERHEIPVGPTLNCSGDLVVTNAGHLTIYAGLTHPALDSNYGALVAAGGDIRVSSNGWIHPTAHPTNGTVPLFTARNFRISADGGFDANVRGFGNGRVGGNATNDYNCPYGPGISTNLKVNYAEANAGSSHGGQGSRGYSGYPGPTYGSAEKPIQPGSGGRSGWASWSRPGSWGGGSIQLRAEEELELSGSLLADGGIGARNYGAPSAGGAIYIRCNTLIADSQALLSADGGRSQDTTGTSGGGAGGGRIAIWRKNDLSPGQPTISVSGGQGNTTYDPSQGEDGTIHWGWVPSAGTILRIH